MLTKKKYKESPIETLKLDDTNMWQKRNGNMICKIYEEKPFKEANQLKSIDYLLYVLNGSISFQILIEGKERNKKDAIEILNGECIFLPKGYYYYWVGKHGVKFVTVTDNAPQELFDAINATNKYLTTY